MTININLNDILNISDKELSNTKVRLTIKNDKIKQDPHDVYINNPEEVTKNWFLWKQEKQDKPFKIGQMALCLLNIGKDRWLFVSAQNILDYIDNDCAGVHYSTNIIEKYEKYFGRLVIKYHNKSQQLCRNANTIMDKLVVTEILPASYEGKSFPGYENVTITWNELNTILKNQKQDWITALKNQKGIYLITDVSNGKHYVGSAYGKEMLLQRWTCYNETGHGGNVKLKKLPFIYIKNNFKYSILETYNSTIPDDVIIKREQWWKNALESIEFGYNDN